MSATAKPSGCREARGIAGSAFQRAWLRRCLFRSVFRLGWQIRAQPLDDAAFEGRHLIAQSNEFGCESGACEFVRIRVVDHDIAIFRERPGCARLSESD